MLKKFILENYRCFEKTEISFTDLSIIVGKNNAGKTTLIEALRILSIVVNRCGNIHYTKPPDWLEFDEPVLGIRPSISNLEISTRNIFFMYREGPAKISAIFENNVSINIYIGEDADVFACIYNAQGMNVESKRFAATLKLHTINILPQISPLLKIEQIVKTDTVQRNMFTYLSSRNFRNQLNLYPKEFDKFKELSEKTWQGLEIKSDSKNIKTQGELFLFVRDNRFEAEIGWMGHGLQMWLQTMWFLSRSHESSTIILDEPDVYMHADLQRRLIKLVKNRFRQIIIATHSIEIMSEVEAKNILPINNTKSKQEYAGKTPIVQKIVNDIGSVHNIEIARLFSYNKFLIVEGEKEDVKLLSIFQSKIFPDTFEQFDILPKTFVQGWGGWQRVIGSNKVFKDNKANLATYCIFDSDYHTEDDKLVRLKDAKEHGINLHIWNKKEIENYLIVPGAIARLLSKKKKLISLEISQVEKLISNLCDEMKDDTIDSFATEIKAKNNLLDIKTANQKARAYVNARWNDNKTSLVSGKQLLSLISKWTIDNYRVSFDKFSLAREITLQETCKEMVDIITCIEYRLDFNN